MSTGVMFNTDRMDGAAFTEFGQRVEDLGLDTIWVPELFGREPFAAAAHLLSTTKTVRVATGIANVYARDGAAAAAGANTMAELSGGRFALGLGVSNAGLAGQRGHAWEPPIAKLATYFDALEAAPYWSVTPAEKPPIYVAAHGPKMVELAAARCDGINTWLMTPEHTSSVRARLDASQTINVSKFALLSDDPDLARTTARKALGMYLGLDYYHRAWRALGFGDEDFADTGSDRLIDALVAWGDEGRIRDLLQEHRDAGADHLVVVPLNATGGGQPDWELLHMLGGSK